MRDIDGRWRNRRAPTPVGPALVDGPSPRMGAGGPAARREEASLAARIGTAAIAFRGYDQANLGRSAELLDHPAYGPVVREELGRTSAIAAGALGAPVDLAAYVRAGRPTSLADFPLDVALIVGMELAQVRLLEEFFGVAVRGARLSFGYSIGEVAAMVLGGLFELEQLLPIPLSMAADCAELAADCSMGILFTRGPLLPPEDVERACTAVRNQGRGLIGPSAYLAPNTALVLGQGDTLDRLEPVIPEFLPEGTRLRRKDSKWPPLHTPLVWQKNIPNRTAVAAYRIAGGDRRPSPPVLSGVTGEDSYDEVNSRELLIDWTDHPQRLWDVIDHTLAAGVELVLHVGPAPNLIPATFARVSDNVSKRLGRRYLNLLGYRVLPSLHRYAWLNRLLASRTAILRAPFVEHIILEDWLLAQEVPERVAVALPAAADGSPVADGAPS